MRSPRRDHTPHAAESLQTRLRKSFFGLVCVVAVTIALSALPILIEDLDVSSVPLRKVLSYEANIVLMESSIGLGESYSKQASSRDQSSLRHVIILAHHGALRRRSARRCTQLFSCKLSRFTARIVLSWNKLSHMSLLHPTMPVYPRFVSDLPLKRPHQLLPCCCQSDD